MRNDRVLYVLPKGNIGVLLFMDGTVGFHPLGSTTDVSYQFESGFDLKANKNWYHASAGLDSIHEAFEAVDKLDDALGVLEEFLERDYCSHDTFETESGEEVCLDPDCRVARAEALLVEDYETARRTRE